MLECLLVFLLLRHGKEVVLLALVRLAVSFSERPFAVLHVNLFLYDPHPLPILDL